MCAVFLLFQNTRAHTTAHLLQRRSKFIAFSFHFLCVFCFQKIIKNRKWKEKMIFRSCLISFCLRIIQYIHYQRMFCWSLFSLWLRSPHSFAHWIYDFTCRSFKLATRLFRHLSKQNELNSYKKNNKSNNTENGLTRFMKCETETELEIVALTLDDVLIERVSFNPSHLTTTCDHLTAKMKEDKNWLSIIACNEFQANWMQRANKA